MFIELPSVYQGSDDENDITTDLLVIDTDIIHSFNPSSDKNRTTIRVNQSEVSWQIDMPYDEFKAMFEEVHGKIKSFIKTGFEI